MQRWCALLVAGLLVLGGGAAALPAMEGRLALSHCSTPIMDGGPLPLLIKNATAGQHPIQVTASGKLHFSPSSDVFFGPYHAWQVQIDGRVYGLDLGSDKKLQQLVTQLKGKMIELTGTVRTVWFSPPHILELPEPPAVLVTVIQVTSLKASQGNQAKPSIVMEVQGTLEKDLIDILKTGPTASKLLLMANGKNYQLDFGKNKDLPQIARKCVGHKVLLRGYYETRTRPSNVVGTSLPPKVGYVHEDVFVVTEIVFTAKSK
jgi:hypothetical protein